MGECIVCRGRPARRGRCWTCYQYLRRTGRDRTAEMILAANIRRLDDEIERRVIAAVLHG